MVASWVCIFESLLAVTLGHGGTNHSFVVVPKNSIIWSELKWRATCRSWRVCQCLTFIRCYRPPRRIMMPIVPVKQKSLRLRWDASSTKQKRCPQQRQLVAAPIRPGCLNISSARMATGMHRWSIRHRVRSLPLVEKVFPLYRTWITIPVMLAGTLIWKRRSRIGRSRSLLQLAVRVFQLMEVISGAATSIRNRV